MQRQVHKAGGSPPDRGRVSAGVTGGIPDLQVDADTGGDEPAPAETVEFGVHSVMADSGDGAGVHQVQAGGDHRRLSARTFGSARSGPPQMSGSSKASSRNRRPAAKARAALTVSTLLVVPSSRAAALNVSSSMSIVVRLTREMVVSHASSQPHVMQSRILRRREDQAVGVNTTSGRASPSRSSISAMTWPSGPKTP